MAIGTDLTSGALTIGGNILAGILGQESFSEGQQVLPTSDPLNNFGSTAQLFDALSQIGFGQIGSVASPVDQFVNRINALPVSEKVKRRALLALQQGLEGRPEFRARTGRDAPKGVQHRKELDNVLRRFGMQFSDIEQLGQQEAAFKSQIQQLSDAGLGGLNTQQILDRERVRQTSAGLLGSGAEFARTGQVQPGGLQSRFQENILRDLDREEDRILLRARHGGFQPGEALGELGRARADSDLSALAQVLQVAGALNVGSNAGLGAAQAGVSALAGQQNNALAIAAQQANVANQLRTGIESRNASTRAGATAGAFQAAADTVQQTSLASQLDDNASVIQLVGSLFGGGAGGLGGAAAGAGATAPAAG